MLKNKKIFVVVTASVVGIIAIGAGGVYASKKIERNKAIGEAEACKFAYMDAGVTADETLNTVVEFKYDDGQYIYEVEFLAKGAEYEYDIKASDGAVLSRSVEQDEDVEQVAEKSAVSESAMQADEEVSKTAKKSSYISVEKAKETALADAGVSSGKVTYTKAKMEKDDGRMIFEIEFYCGSTEYEYGIDAVSGKIIDSDSETETNEDDDDD